MQLFTSMSEQQQKEVMVRSKPYLGPFFVVVNANPCGTAVQMIFCDPLTKNIEEHWKLHVLVSTIFFYGKGN